MKMNMYMVSLPCWLLLLWRRSIDCLYRWKREIYASNYRFPNFLTYRPLIELDIYYSPPNSQEFLSNKVPLLFRSTRVGFIYLWKRSSSCCSMQRSLPWNPFCDRMNISWMHAYPNVFLGSFALCLVYRIVHCVVWADEKINAYRYYVKSIRAFRAVQSREPALYRNF